MSAPAPLADFGENIRVIFRSLALRRVLEHARENTNRELGGLLLGRLTLHQEKWLVTITGLVRAVKARSGRCWLSFCPETWNDMLCRIDNHSSYSDEDLWKIVGWYHTHPNLGLSFSDLDIQLHLHFSHPGHIALVLDPVKGDKAVYYWGRNQEKMACYPRSQIEELSDEALCNLLQSLDGQSELISLPEADITFNS